MNRTAFLIILFASTAAIAQTAVFDQVTLPFTSGQSNSEVVEQSYPVSGGTIYIGALKAPGSAQWSFSQAFAPVAAGGLTRYLPLTHSVSDVGVPITATPGSGAFGISRTAGTSLVLTGEATSSSAKTDKALWDFVLPDSYQPGTNISVTVNCKASGGTITGASTTMTVNAYTESNTGTEAALSVSAAQQIAATSGDLTFTITGTGLTPGGHVSLEAVMLVTTSAGAGTGVINSVRYGA